MKISDLAELARDNRDQANWYDRAHAELVIVCDATGWSVDTLAAVLAVTSPRVSVRRNIRIALRWMNGDGLFPNVMSNIAASLDKYLATGSITGPKTLPFYKAIMGDAAAIVLDVHMADLFGVDQSKLSSKPLRQRLESTVRRVARRVAMSPRDCQAALWTGQLRRRGRVPTMLPIVQEFANMLAHCGFPDCGAIPQLAMADGRYQRSLFQ